MNSNADPSAGQAIPPKPFALPVIPENIPDELKARAQWVVWRWLWKARERKWDKPLFNPKTGNLADHGNPKTWGTYELALGQYIAGGFDGIGYVFWATDPYAGVDLDHRVSPETGNLDPGALAIVERLSSYTEYSPSGEGLHILIKAKLPPTGRKHPKKGFECYDRLRYFTMTGQHLKGTPLTIAPRQDAMAAVHAEVFAADDPLPLSTASSNGAGPSPSVDDDRIIQKALAAKNGERFGQLMAGDTAGYRSQSEADLALCRLLAFFTQDEAQVDRLFRQSALYREKWERTDYRDKTIDLAIRTAHEHWSGVSADSSNGHPRGTGASEPEQSAEDAHDALDPPGTQPDDESWKADLSRTKQGTPLETLGNVSIALWHLEPWASTCWYDAVRDIFMVGDEHIDDAMVIKAALHVEEQAKIPIRSRSLVTAALTHLCHKQPRDLLREWLESLPPWDQHPRLASWLQTYAHAPDDAYGHDVSRLIPVSMVARALHPGCQYRYVVILEGLENSGKTKLVREIATPEWYRELSQGLDGKEAHMRIKRAWVAELAELSSMIKTEEPRLKSFFTLNEDTYIPKYSNFEVVHQRRSVFIGTVNPEGDNTYLKGQTGNTRYLPISVRDINIEGFQAIRTQLFAEALRYYLDHPGDWWQLSSEGEYLAVELRNERRQRSIYEDDLGAWLERTHRKVTWWEDIAENFLNLERNKWDRRIQMEVAKALKAQHWEKGKRERVDNAGLVWTWKPSDDWHPVP
jgi:hypothetical protein